MELKMINKKSILFYVGNFNKNSITKSFLNLVNSIDLNKFEVSLCLEKKYIDNNEERQKELEQVTKEVSFIYREGCMQLTIEEKKLLKAFEVLKAFPNLEIATQIQNLYEDEYKRIFKNRYFDTIIHYEGYNLFWTRVFAYAPKDMVCKKINYMHYNMFKIWKDKYSNLEFNFLLYKKFDYLISISEELSTINYKSLEKLFNISKNKFIFIPKIHSRKESLEEAKANLSEKNLFFNTKVFINISRLVKENEQEKLIYAFEKVFKIDSTTRFVFLGVGALESKLRALIQQLNLSGKVFLLGQRYSPISYLEKADCLVDGSKSFEQSMILKEALFLKKPIITTNTAVHKIIVNNNVALFVENNQNAFYQAMLSFLEDDVEVNKVFNYHDFNQNILKKFYFYILN